MRARTRTNDVVTLGGWLFAELAVVLMVIALGSVPPPRPAPPPQPLPAPTREEGVLLVPVSFAIFIPESGDGQETVNVFNRKLGEVVGPDRQVGLAQLFGISRDGDSRNGVIVSDRLKQLVANVAGLRTAVDVRAYVGDRDDGEPGEVRVELFLLTRSR